jgi:glycosyltransferase involved in cell wall biosynthesis
VPANAEDDPAAPAIATSDGAMRVAFVGTYGPRRCGIATFTADLARAVAGDRRVSPVVLAVTDPAGQYQYPVEVKFEIRQNVKADYARAAEFVNFSNVRLVCIQHEYGIFGGDDGGYLLDFVYALRVPAVVTLHTVLKRPSESQAAIVQKMWERCAQLVVMSQIAKDLLATSYGVSGSKVRIIPHGIPLLDRRADRRLLKAEFGVAGRRLLLTFGLLSRNKGIETVIRALPALVRRFPDAMYIVVGATHPTIVRREGEAYRTQLEREAEKLGVRDHVAFRAQFVADEELHRYLQAADVFISPYLSEAQVTSGALSYAMGAGAAVVSTPYWHAQELLAGGRGRLFPFNDHEALSQTLLELFSSPAELRRTRDAAFALAREMAWPQVGNAYFGLIHGTVRAAAQEPVALPAAEPLAVSSCRISASTILRMTDDTGIIQHAATPCPCAAQLLRRRQCARVNGGRTRRPHSGLRADAYARHALPQLSASVAAADGALPTHELRARSRLGTCVGRLHRARDLASRSPRAWRQTRLPHARARDADAPYRIGNLARGSAQVVLGLVTVLAAEPGAVEERRLLDGLVVAARGLSRECDRRLAVVRVDAHVR